MSFKSQCGEISILVKKAQILSKSLLPLPEKFHGLKDDEERYWVSKNNYGELSSLLEHNFHNYIWYADIELEKGGYIKFHHGQLSVKMNNFSELKLLRLNFLRTENSKELQNYKG